MAPPPSRLAKCAGLMMMKLKSSKKWLTMSCLAYWTVRLVHFLKNVLANFLSRSDIKFCDSIHHVLILIWSLRRVCCEEIVNKNQQRFNRWIHSLHLKPFFNSLVTSNNIGVIDRAVHHLSRVCETTKCNLWYFLTDQFYAPPYILASLMELKK